MSTYSISVLYDFCVMYAPIIKYTIIVLAIWNWLKEFNSLKFSPILSFNSGHSVYKNIFPNFEHVIEKLCQNSR